MAKIKTLVLPVIVIFVLGFLSGCIRSRVIITSDPPGAEVKFNNVPRGRTPITIPFIWYWYYDVELEKEGYEKIVTKERFRAPVWFYIPFDFFMEALPFPIYDTKYRHYVLTPKKEEM